MKFATKAPTKAVSTPMEARAPVRPYIRIGQPLTAEVQDGAAKAGQYIVGRAEEATAHSALHVTPLAWQEYYSIQPEAVADRHDDRHDAYAKQIGEGAAELLREVESTTGVFELGRLPLTGGPKAYDVFRKPGRGIPSLGIRTIRALVYVHEIEQECELELKGSNFVAGAELRNDQANERATPHALVYKLTTEKASNGKHQWYHMAWDRLDGQYAPEKLADTLLDAWENNANTAKALEDAQIKALPAPPVSSSSTPKAEEVREAEVDMEDTPF